MNFHKIVKIITGILGLLGIVFLFLVILPGDEEIKSAASMGDFSKVAPLIGLAQAILVITVISTLIFSLLGLFSDKEKLKKALFSIVGLLVVLGVAYATSDGVETPMKDGEVLSAMGSSNSPNFDSSPIIRASIPSKKSVNDAITNIANAVKSP